MRSPEQLHDISYNNWTLSELKAATDGAPGFTRAETEIATEELLERKEIAAIKKKIKRGQQ